MTNIGSLYKVYLERYNKAAKEANRKNLPIDDKFTKDQFKAMFEAYKRTEGFSDLKDTQVVRKLIDRQRYGTTTEAQGRAVYQAMKARGMDVDIATIKAYYSYMGSEQDWNDLPKHLRESGQPIKDFFDEIDMYYKLKRAEGYDAQVVKRLIAQVYFGSP